MTSPEGKAAGLIAAAARYVAAEGRGEPGSSVLD
jgi:hypothetical protein